MMKNHISSALVLLFYALFIQYTSVCGVSQGTHFYDQIAPIGQLFAFQLPNAALHDNAKDYKVTEAGSDTLPDWILWNRDSLTLYGVPNRRDYLPVPRYLISVTAIDDLGQKISKIVTITVVQDGMIKYGDDLRSFRNELRSNSKNDKTLTREICHFSDTSLIMMTVPAESFLPIESRRSAQNTFNDPKSNYELLKKIVSLTALQSSLVRLLDASYVISLERSSGLENTPENSSIKFNHSVDSAFLFILGCGDLDEDEEIRRQAILHSQSIVSRLPMQNADLATTSVPARPFAARLAVPLPRKRWALDGDVELSQWSGGKASYVTQEVDQADWTSTPSFVISTSASPRATHAVDDDQDVDVEDDVDDDEEEDDADELSLRQTSRGTRQWTATSRTPVYTNNHRSGISKGSTPQSTFKRLQIDGEMEETTPPIRKGFDHRPQLKHSLGSIRCTKNMLCEQKIPKHTFFDEEDGSTESLSLKVNLIKGPVQDVKSWLLLNEAKQLLVGIPMVAGTWEFQLTAKDSADNSITDAFEVHVLRPAHFDGLTSPSHEFSIGLALPFASFSADIAKHVQFVRRLAQNLGDAHDASNVQWNGVEPDPNNASLSIVRWSNATLVGLAANAFQRRSGVANDAVAVKSTSNDLGTTKKVDPTSYDAADICLKNQVDAVLKVQQTNLFRDRMNTKLFPFVYVLRSFAHWCANTSQTAVKFPIDTGKSGSAADSSASDNLFLATVLPVIIVLTLLCLALLVACLLYRKNRRAKKSAAKDSSSGRSPGGGDARFLSAKGKPVIFPDEVLDVDRAVEDEEKISAHTPMLLKDEKPPIAPPDFSRLNGSSNGIGKTAATERQSSASPLLTGRSSTGVPYPAGFQSPLSGVKLANRQQRAAAAPSVDECEMTTGQRPLLQHEEYGATDDSLLPRKQQSDGRTPSKNVGASPQTRQPPPFAVSS